MTRALLLASLMLLGCGGSTPPAPPDLAGMTDMQLLPFGAACTMDAQCASGACFVGGNQTFCSLHCTAATQATDCPVPPTSGVCNMKGYCKP
jgi:hypothetical protein